MAPENGIKNLIIVFGIAIVIVVGTIIAVNWDRFDVEITMDKETEVENNGVEKIIVPPEEYEDLEEVPDGICLIEEENNDGEVKFKGDCHE